MNNLIKNHNLDFVDFDDLMILEEEPYKKEMTILFDFLKAITEESKC